MKHTILIVDDDPHIRDVLRYALEKENVVVIEAENGQTGLDILSIHKPDIIILDVMMPEMNGLDFCQRLRQSTDSPLSRTPILFLSSRSDEIDRVLGLELGGDDYMSKPFSPRELLAKVKAILRRLEFSNLDSLASSQTSVNDILEQGLVRLDITQYQVTFGNKLIILTATEFNLLELFLRTPQKVYTRDELVQLDVFKDIVSDRTVDSHIRRLRQKFTQEGCNTVIETAHGFGYKLGPCQ